MTFVGCLVGPLPEIGIGWVSPEVSQHSLILGTDGSG